MFPIIFFLILSGAANASIPPQNAVWDRTGEKDGIELFRRETEGSDLIELKGKGIVEAPLWKLAAILFDTERAPEWVDSLERSSVVRRLSPLQYIEYNHIRTPFFMKDRDFVSLVHIHLDPQRKIFSLQYRPSDEVVETDNHIRGVIEPGLFELKALDSTHTLLTGEVRCDPMGSLPKWLVNFFQSDWAYDTIQALRLQAKKPDIRMPSEFRRVLERTLKF